MARINRFGQSHDQPKTWIYVGSLSEGRITTHPQVVVLGFCEGNFTFNETIEMMEHFHGVATTVPHDPRYRGEPNTVLSGSVWKFEDGFNSALLSLSFNMFGVHLNAHRPAFYPARFANVAMEITNLCERQKL